MVTNRLSKEHFNEVKGQRSQAAPFHNKVEADALLITLALFSNRRHLGDVCYRNVDDFDTNFRMGRDQL